MPGQVFHDPEGVGLQDKLVVLRTEVTGDPAGVIELVVLSFRETNGEGLHGTRSEPGRGRDDGAGVDAAAQEGAYRHIAHEMQIDGFLEQLAKLIRVAAFALTVVRLEAHVPVLFDSHRMLRFPREPVPGCELAHSLDDALRRGCGQEGEDVRHGPPVDRARDLGQLQDRLQLRGEDQPSADLGVIERLDPEPVARQE